MKFIFDTIKAKLLADLPTLLLNGSHVDLWNDQLIMTEEGKGLLFPFPSVFIGFPEPIDFVGQVGGVSKAQNVIVRLHNITKQPQRTNFDFHTLKQLTFFSINGLMGTDTGDSLSNFSALQRISETYDEDKKLLYHFQQDYTTNWTDNSANIDNKGLTHSPANLDISAIFVSDIEDC